MMILRTPRCEYRGQSVLTYEIQKVTLLPVSIDCFCSLHGFVFANLTLDSTEF